jgi:hypothetical protein
MTTADERSRRDGAVVPDGEPAHFERQELPKLGKNSSSSSS